MGRIIDFSTSCPWQLYTFSFVHIIASIFMFLFDACYLVFPTKTQSCAGSEIVMSRFVALCLLYVGVIFTILTYHVKRSPEKVTRLSNLALNGATALLVGCIFAGNKSHGGFERGWMNVVDVLTMFVLVGILASRVSESSAVWAERIPVGDGLGINCKTLLLLFVIMTFVKIIALTDFVDPESFVLAGGVTMTKLAHYMWSFIIVLVLEIFLGLTFSLIFDDDASHELMIVAIALMTAIVIGSIYPVTEYMSDWYDFTGKGIWIKFGIVLALCGIAIAGGRMTGRRGGGYQGVGEGASLNV